MKISDAPDITNAGAVTGAEKLPISKGNGKAYSVALAGLKAFFGIDPVMYGTIVLNKKPGDLTAVFFIDGSVNTEYVVVRNNIQFANLPMHNSNAAAAAGGVMVGSLYKTSASVVMVREYDEGIDGGGGGGG